MNKYLISALLACFCIATVQAADNYNLKKLPKGATAKEIGDKVGWRYIRVGHSHSGKYSKTVPRHLAYPNVCTWLGGLWFAKQTDNKELYRALSDRFARFMWAETYLLPVPNHVDNNVFGVVPLELYKTEKEQSYYDLGMMYANSQWDVPQDVTPEGKAWADKGYSWQTRLWIDDMFMITAIQAQAYQVTGDRKYIDRAAKEMVLYLDSIQQPNGLFFHSPEARFLWGRGNGWMAVGMTELLRFMPEDNENRPRILKEYRKMMATLLKYQAEDGMWRQLIDVKESWKETSCTGMFTYAMIMGVKNEWLDKKIYGAAARKAWLTLITYIDEKGNISEVCGGTNIKNDFQHYMNRPRIVGDLHGQAPVLWCAYALSLF